MKFRKLLMSFLFILLLAGCTRVTFNYDNAVNTLLDNGYHISVSYKTEEELAQAKSLIESQIRFDKYEMFEFEVLEILTFSNYVDDSGTNASFLKFATNEQANNYYQYSISTRREESNWRDQLVDNIVILTKDDNVTKLLNLNLK